MNSGDNEMFEVVIVNYTYTRYAIVDRRRRYKKDRYWKGGDDQAWTNKREKAMQFANYAIACEEMQRITEYEHRHLPKTVMTVSLDVTVLGEGFTRDQLIAYIARTLVLRMEYQHQGMGPIPGVIVLVDCDIDGIQERSSTDGDVVPGTIQP